MSRPGALADAAPMNVGELALTTALWSIYVCARGTAGALAAVQSLTR
jgi:hypothetical protein